MDRNLRDAAARGDRKPFKDMANDVIESLVTVTNNTILHIHIIAQSQDVTNTGVSSTSTKFIEEILDKCPSLLLQVNAKGDTPLHVAAKFGCVDIVSVLIERAKSQHDDLESGTARDASCRKMIGMLNNEKNTALHEAVCRCSLDIVKILMKEEPEFPYSDDDYGETPLYMAAARGSSEIVAVILGTCPSAAHQGPGEKTALHAAVLLDPDGAMIRQIVERQKSLIRARDQYGWTPLHYAAYFRLFNNVEVLLEYDRSAATIVDKDLKMTALHLAAAQACTDIVELIISYYPECCEVVDDRGWNVLHFTMLSFNAKELEKILKNPLVRNLINEKDAKGNTPLHVLAAFCHFSTYRIVKYASGVDYEAVKKQKMSVAQIANYGSRELQQEIRELSKGVDRRQYPKDLIKIKENKWESEPKSRVRRMWQNLGEGFLGIKEASESQLVVCALIATVTFTAGLTLPGGYIGEGQDQGTAILSRKAAFQAFVITDAIAMVLSLSAVFIHFMMSLKALKDLVTLFLFALLFTLVAMVAMVVAFITGTYAMLSPSLGLAIVTCFIGLSFFLIFFLFYWGLRKHKS